MHSLMQGVPIFAGLDSQGLDLLLQRVEEMTVAAGDLVLREGELGNRFFLIGSGSVRVCKQSGQPEEVELARLGPRDFFGEMCILETLPRSATVQALAPSTLFSLPSTAFYHLYKARPEQYCILLLNIARDLSRRLRRLDEAFAARH
ncbi:MAG: cyclic nucleotide-binding domain-containing protein [Chloroflexi bacterium]|nr:cyclic nucleotide-binding domain-containing protein [Chloroflexota bacterium]